MSRICKWCADDHDCEADAEIARLRAAGNEAFLAMCAYRDGDDEECFQDAIDGLGCALKEKT